MPQSAAPELPPLPDWLSAQQKISLGHFPTPLTPLDRLSELLGGPRVWLKRDDCSGLATGGNKTRKLEYLLADARARGADAVLTFGAVQSNHARQTAAACAAIGLPCHLILTRRVDWSDPGYEISGNVLLEQILGAEIEIVAPDQASVAARARIEALRAAGQQTYIIPTGGSNAIGAIGYACCAHELLAQSRRHGFRLTDVCHATSSAGTQSGLLAGFAIPADTYDERPFVHGINVYTSAAAQLEASVLEMSRQCLEAHTPAGRERIEQLITSDAVRVDSRYLGEDYGRPTELTIAAIKLLARTEGILLDPVYSGKAFGALVDRIRGGEFDRTRDIVFIHTGGTAVLPVYQQAFG